MTVLHPTGGGLGAAAGLCWVCHLSMGPTGCRGEQAGRCQGTSGFSSDIRLSPTVTTHGVNTDSVTDGGVNNRAVNIVYMAVAEFDHILQ